MTAPHSLLRACFLIGVLGAFLPIPADIISWFLAENYSPVADTISNLAVGPSSWLMDLGLMAFGVGCLAAALGLVADGEAPGPARLAGLPLALSGVAAMIIAQVNEYAGSTNPGADIHQWCVWALGPLWASTVFLFAYGLREGWPAISRRSAINGALWIVLAAVYFMTATSWDGAVERVLGLLMLWFLWEAASWIGRGPDIGRI